jgi:pSer/pThr/pTyr-binding forkhead associated (FHA) protein
MPARLTIRFAAAPARELILAEGRKSIVGRDPDCGVVVEDDRVSRRHAAFTFEAAGWTVTDLGSKNGTLVNGVRIESRQLPERSWISFGGLLAHFEALQAPVEALREERLRRLTTALEIRRDLDPGEGLSELLSRAVASMLTLTNAERGFLLLVRDDGDFEVAARSGLSWDDLRAAEFSGSVGAVEQVLSGGRPVVSTDAREDAELGARASIVMGGIRALLCVPVHALDRRIGVMYADSRQPGAAFTELDLEILEELAAQAGIAIGVARLNSELRGLAERIADDSAEETLRPERRSTVSAPVVPGAKPAAPEKDFRDTWHGLLAAQDTLGAAS